MHDTERENPLGELIHLAMDCMGVAVTIIDAKGTLLYYNRHSAKILDRKPEYIGIDIHSHHKKTDSNPKLDLMLKSFEEGRKDAFHYEAKPYGKTICVTLSPIIENDKFVGCVQTVRLKNTVSENQ
jgi:sensor histidine kinase regulating citrate/malate metabolism